MDFATDLPVFSIPFRYQWNRNFAGELDIVGSQIDGIIRFIGDRKNLLIKGIFSDDFSGVRSADRSLVNLSPFVLYGASGTGKTSLALELVSELCTAPIIFTAADFDRRYRSAMEISALPEFRAKLLQSSGLLIDDLQLLAGKPAVQSELAGIIDRLVPLGIPLIFTADVNPLNLSDFSSQLISRLSQGSLLSLLPPGDAARHMIIRDLAQLHRFILTDEAISFLVRRFGSSTVPRMNHFFGQLGLTLRCHQNQLSRSSSNEPKIIDLPLVSRLFELPPDEMLMVANGIIDIVAHKFRIKRKDITGSTRKQSVVLARSVAIYLIRDFLGSSFSWIGRLFANRDHSTVLHSYHKIKKMANRYDHTLSPDAAIDFESAVDSVSDTDSATTADSTADSISSIALAPSLGYSEFNLISDLSLLVADFLTTEINFSTLP